MASETVDYMLSQIFNNINDMVLRLAFEDRSAIPPIPLSENIISKIIDKVILRDMNTLALRPKAVALESQWLENTVDSPYQNLQTYHSTFSVHRIPPQYRDNMAIIEVLGVIPSGFGHGSAISTPMQGSTAIGTGMMVLDSIAHTNHISVPLCERVDNDLIRLIPAQYHGMLWTVQLGLGYDLNFTGLNSSAKKPLGELALAAVKKYIYIHRRIDLDQGFIETGAEYTAIREIIDTYQSAGEEYRELLTRVAGMTRFDVQRMLAVYRTAL